MHGASFDRNVCVEKNPAALFVYFKIYWQFIKASNDMIYEILDLRNIKKVKGIIEKGLIDSHLNDPYSPLGGEF